MLDAWDSDLFDEKYIPAVAKEEQLYEQHAAFTSCLTHLCDALEVVDWRSGEIRDRATNAWLLEQTLTALAQIAHVRVVTWLRTLRRYQKQLLTYLDWLAAALAPYAVELAQTLVAPQAHSQFMRQVARTWRLRQALISGHTHLRTIAQRAERELQTACADCPTLLHLAQRLMAILNGACRASSLVENVNGLLKQFLHNRRRVPSGCRNPVTLQLYLNLFTLWHNMRVFERRKRQGQSPYQLAGIQPKSDDWLALLGYPAV